MKSRKIGIIHLSDIHLRKDSDPIVNRVENIAAAATSQYTDIDLYIIAITGDVANWGLTAEYDLARELISKLMSTIRERTPNKRIELVVIPGNHDCDFQSDRNRVEIRAAVLKSVALEMSSMELSGGLIQQCISIQENFFDFLKDLGNQPILEDHEKIVWIREFKLGDIAIRFQCFNTSWISQISESQGDLRFPTEQAEQVLPTNASNLVVSLLHHPFNWFESANARAFEALLDRTSDVILTGHEHVSEIFTKYKTSGHNIQYFSGAVLQDDYNRSISGFGLVIIDLDTSMQKLVEFVWEEDRYSPRKKNTWVPFNRNRFLQRAGLLNKEAFQMYLDDIGTEYTHPFRKKGGLSFDDLFITPDANEYPFDSKIKRKSVVKSERLLETIVKSRYAVVYGEENSGKTALSKMIYRHLRSNELVPVLLRPGDGLAGHDESSLRDCINLAISDQYSDAAVDQIFQLPAEKRALIIDDLHRFSISAEGRRTLLKTAQSLFGTVVVFATDIYQYQSLIERTGTTKSPFDYTEFKLREFGRKLRGQLIRRWLMIGRELIIDPKDIAKEEDVLERALNATISRNVIPSYPFWIISILQLWNSEKSTNGSFGAFGYIFDGLIAKQLESIGYDATQIDKIYTFLGRLGYQIFSSQEPTVTEEELQEINAKYAQDYRIQLRFQELIDRLQAARVVRNIDGNYQFTQPYILYFFVARYYRENLAANVRTESLRQEIVNMIRHVSYEPYSYILLILVYLTKDYSLITQIIDQSDSIYSDIEPCDLDHGVLFLNKLNPPVDRLQLPASDFHKNRETFREVIDETETEDELDETLVIGEKERIVGYSDDLDDLSKMIFAIKSLDLMGQILRNFPGSLYGEMKVRLAESSYRLGLRTLEGFMILARRSVTELEEHYKSVLTEERADTKIPDRVRAAKDMLIWLASGAAFSIIKRISTAVGHEDLSETYAEVKKKLDDNNSVNLIDLSIKLDHFSGVPHSQIKNLAKQLHRNAFAYNIQRELIKHFLYLFPVAQMDAQKLTSLFDIDTASSKLLLNDVKRSKKRSSKRRSK